jgi:hypothetical protein
VNDGILPANPIVKLGKLYRTPGKVKEKIDPFTSEELHLIEDRCRERLPEYYPFILCIARAHLA